MKLKRLIFFLIMRTGYILVQCINTYNKRTANNIGNYKVQCYSINLFPNLLCRIYHGYDAMHNFLNCSMSTQQWPHCDWVKICLHTCFPWLTLYFKCIDMTRKHLHINVYIRSESSPPFLGNLNI